MTDPNLIKILNIEAISKELRVIYEKTLSCRVVNIALTRRYFICNINDINLEIEVEIPVSLFETQEFIKYISKYIDEALVDHKTYNKFYLEQNHISNQKFVYRFRSNHKIIEFYHTRQKSKTKSYYFRFVIENNNFKVYTIRNKLIVDTNDYDTIEEKLDDYIDKLTINKIKNSKKDFDNKPISVVKLIIDKFIKYKQSLSRNSKKGYLKADNFSIGIEETDEILNVKLSGYLKIDYKDQRQFDKIIKIIELLCDLSK